ncbi:MAG: glycosyltransferase [Verrucomicrobiales bacterium]
MSSSNPRPLVVSLCGTFLKPEMQSVYRQVANLQNWRTIVYTEQRIEEERFPFEPVITLKKKSFRARGNFLWRFYWKHLRGVWPPPGWEPPLPPRDFEFCDLVARLKQDQPEVLHIYYGHKARKYLPLVEKWGGPLVVSFHGVDVAAAQDKAEYAATWEELFQYAKVVMARSQSLLDKLKEMGCPNEKLVMNRTPIPMDHCVFQEKEPPADGQWRCIQACRLIAKKGLLTTLQALETVLPKRPGLQFLIAGEGPLHDKLKKEISRRGWQEQVQLLGWVDQKHLMELFSQCHFFLHPSETQASQDQEGIPNSMLEAMACGLPVVATWHGGIPEAMEHERDGLLVPERDPDALAAAILRLTGEADFYQQSSRQAAKTVRERFALEQQIKAMERAYDRAARR